MQFSFKFVSKRSVNNNIDSDNGLVPSRRQPIIGTKGGPVYWPIYALLGSL